jgi:hypothetical protein
VVAGSGSQFSVTAGASGGSGAGYTYSWSIVAQLATDDPTVAQFCNAQGSCSASQQGPICVGQASCTATLQGAKGGKATLQVSATDNAGNQNQTPAQTRLIVVQFASLNIVAYNSVGGGNIASNDSSSMPLPVGALQWPAAIWAAPNPIVLIGGLSEVTVAVTTTPPASDPDVAISFRAVRAPDDATVIGGSADVPGITPGFNAAMLALNQTGSFQILAYVDTNGNGVRDAGETGIALPLILVSATLNANLSVTNSSNVAWVGDGVQTGDFSFPTAPSSPPTSAIYLGATVDFIGGGMDGLRGIGEVFGGWVNNETANEGIAGLYGGSGGNHTAYTMFASNGSAVTTSFGGIPLFLPSSPAAPIAINPPLLDTGRVTPEPGSGGNSSTLSQSRIGLTTNLAMGQRQTIEAVDSPASPYPTPDPGFPGSALYEADFAHTFRSSLVVWSNAINLINPTGDIADRVYGVVLEQPWTINAAYLVDANGNATAKLPAAVSAGGATVYAPVVPLSSTQATLSPPTVLTVLVLNAQQ